MSLAFAVAGMASCEDTYENPGDFSIQATLDIDREVTAYSGATYALTVASTSDSVFTHEYTVSDTLKHDDGSYVYNDRGQLTITSETKTYPSKFTTKVIDMEPVLLSSAEDTLKIHVVSNARWTADQPKVSTGAQWYYNYLSSVAGGGNGVVYFRTVRNKNYQRKGTATQEIMTSDSTVLIRIPFKQSGEKD